MGPMEFERQYMNSILFEDSLWGVLARIDYNIDGEYQSTMLVHTIKVDIQENVSDHAWGILHEYGPSQSVSRKRSLMSMTQENAALAFENTAKNCAVERTAFAIDAMASIAQSSMSGKIGEV